MSLSYFIAKRYTKEKKDAKFLSLISTITIGGIALGVTVLIIALTILNGFENTIKEKIISFNSHMVVSAFGSRNLPDYKKNLHTIEEHLKPYLESVSPYISKNGIIKSKQRSEGITLIGIDPKNNNYDIKQYITDGSYEVDSNKAVVGKKLADRLFINVGDKLTLFALRNDEMPTFANPPVIDQFVISGIFESGMAQYDDLKIYTNLNYTQDMLRLGDAVSGYNIKLTELTQIDSLRENLQDHLGYPFYVRTLYQMHSNIFTWLELQKEPIPIVLGLIIIVAVFNIVGTLLMIILEKTSAIGILKSLGATKKQIVKLFIYQGVFLSVIGILIGNTLAFTLSILQQQFEIISLPSSVYFISSVPIYIDWKIYLLISGVAFLLSVAASVVPSVIAAGLNPIRAIRFK